jgi:chemotaxis protein MotB
MQAFRLASALLAACVAVTLSGCLFASKTQLTASETQNRVLSEQNRAQLAEIENLKAHGRNIEDQLVHGEQELALLQEQIEVDRKRLANNQHETSELHDQFKGMANARRLPSSVSKQLSELSQRYPSLNFDPATGISKLDTDMLFDSGQADLTPAAQAILGELAHVLQSPEASELKVMVVGHTDNQRVVGKPAREKYPNNFHLSTGRALAVADHLRRQGLSERRIGVAGFGPHQPIVPNEMASDRQKNRRVEIFVMAPDVPVVGWTDSIPSVY